LIQHAGGQPGEDLLFQADGLVGGAAHLLGELRQFRGVEAHGAGQRLAVVEGVVQGRLHQLVAMGRRHLDEIAQHVVVLDLEGGDPGHLPVLALQTGDQPAAFVAQRAQLVQPGIVPPGDEVAVACDEGRIGGQRRVQLVHQGGMGAQAFRRRREAPWHLLQRGDVRRFDEAAQLPGGGQPVADGRQVARPAPADAKAGQCAFDIRAGFQAGAQVAAQPLPVVEEFHHVQPLVDLGEVRRGRGQAAFQEPCAGPGDGAVYGGDEAAPALAAQRFHELQVAPCRRVDDHAGIAAGEHRPLEARHGALLRLVDIIEQRAGGAQPGARDRAHAVQRAQPEDLFEPPLAPLAVEAHARQGGECCLEDGEPFGHLFRRLVAPGVGHQDLAGLDAGEIGLDIGGAGRGDAEITGRHVRPGDGPLLSGQRHGGQEIGRAGVEQVLLGQCAGGDEAHHLALDHGLGAAFLGLRRVLHLFAHRHLVALADEAGEIEVAGVHGHAAHGDLLALVLAALGERDIERRRGNGRILEEQFVEIPHAVEQEHARMRRLDVQILGHHGRHRRRLFALGGIGGCFLGLGVRQHGLLDFSREAKT